MLNVALLGRQPKPCGLFLLSFQHSSLRILIVRSFLFSLFSLVFQVSASQHKVNKKSNEKTDVSNKRSSLCVLEARKRNFSLLSDVPT